MALDRLTKIDGGGISTTSNYRVGIITASKFVGPIEGAVTGTASTATLAVNAQGLTGTPDIVVGILTASSANFSGNVTIGGTLTYEDVTNIDSVGIITAQKDIHVGAGLSVVGIVTAATFKGDGDFVDIDVDGHTNLDNVSISGVTTITSIAPEIHFTDTNHDSDYSIVVNSGRLRFRDRTNSNVDRFYITSDGSNYLNGDVHLGEIFFGTGSRTRVYSGGGTHVKNALMVTNPSATVTGRGAGVALCGVGQTNDYIGTLYVRRSALGDNRGTTYLEAKDDIIINTNAATSTKTVLTAGADGNISINNDLDVDGHTNLDNVSVAGIVTITNSASGIGLKLIDASSKQFVAGGGGGGSPFAGSQSGHDFRIQVGGLQNAIFKYAAGATGNLELGPSSGIGITFNGSTGNAGYAGIITATKFVGDGSSLTGIPAQATIANNADNRVITGGSGVNLYAESNFTFDGTDVQVPDKINLNTNGSYVKENQLQFKSSGTAYIDHGTTSQNIIFRMSNSSSLDTNVLTISPTGLSFHDLNITNVGTIALDSIKGDADDNTNITFAGSDVITFKAGATSPALTINTTQVKVEDDQELTVGTGNDLKIYHTTSGTSWIRHTNSSEYFILEGNQMDFRDYATGVYRARMGAAVQLYYNGNNEKFRTTDTGITVTGEVATAQDYPTIRPTLDFNFAAEKKLDPRITYRRTGPASFVNEFGKVVLVGDNAPRFDHDPDTRESKGLLIEEARTNQWLYSEDIATYVTGGYLQQSTLADTTDTTNPTGGTNVVKMAATAVGGAHSFYRNFTSGSNGDTHTASVWVKAAGVDYARIYVDTVGGNLGGSGVTFSTGNTWTTAANGSGTTTRTSAVKYPNGWWRLSVSGSFSSQNQYYVHVDLEGGEGDVGFTGNGSDGMYIWGIQFEAGDFPSSYMPTSGSSVTRGTENVKIDGDDFTDFYNQSEGTLVSEFMINDTTTLTSGAIVNINALSTDSYADSIMFMEIGTASGYYGRVYKNSNGTSLTGSGNITTNGIMGGTMFNRVSFAWSDTVVNEGLAAYRNGTVVNTSSTETNTPTNMTEMDIGRGWASQYINAHIKRLMYYSKRLPDNQLATLTA